MVVVERKNKESGYCYVDIMILWCGHIRSQQFNCGGKEGALEVDEELEKIWKQAEMSVRETRWSGWWKNP